MERLATTVKSLDSIKVYLWMMGCFTFITAIWLICNYFELGDNHKKMNYSWQDYNNMLELEKDIPVGEEKNCKIDNVFAFFRGRLPVKPVKVVPGNRVVNANQLVFKEHTYTITYSGLYV